MSGFRESGQALAMARRSGLPLAVLPGGLPGSELEAYAIQAEAVTAYDGTRCGFKIGATSSAAQASFGTDHPFSAPIFGESCWADGSIVDVPAHGLVGFEAEFAFRLRADLPSRDRPYALDDLRAAVAAVHPAFEIVGLRLPKELFANMLVVIADLGANVGFVPGEAVEDWQSHDLGAAAVRVGIDGEAVARGSGAAVLGHPLNALLWLAEHLRVSGSGLSAGDFVSTGACAGIIAVAPGQTITADFGPFGTVRTTLDR
jgi:2-oxo-3-hexenedioate decarboxylase/2-keto-4-pentenoate hydratase